MLFNVVLSVNERWARAVCCPASRHADRHLAGVPAGKCHERRAGARVCQTTGLRSESAMKILVSGSSGPKVAARVAAMLAHTHEVIGVDMAPSTTTSIVADITRINDWRSQLRDTDAVIHLAIIGDRPRLISDRLVF